MIGSSKNNRENYPRKCFWTQEKETRFKFNPGLSANRPANNWAQKVKFICETVQNPCILGLHLCTRIWVRAMIGLLKKPLLIWQSGWQEISKSISGNLLELLGV